MSRNWRGVISVRGSGSGTSGKAATNFTGEEPFPILPPGSKPRVCPVNELSKQGSHNLSELVTQTTSAVLEPKTDVGYGEEEVEHILEGEIVGVLPTATGHARHQCLA